MKKCVSVCILLVTLFSVCVSAQTCDASGTRTDCGYSGITQSECVAKGCCWSPLNPNPDNEPWCFYGNGIPTPTPPPPPLACDVSGIRIDCGYSGIDQAQCEANNCCWDEVNPNPNNLPWCFSQNIFPPTPTPPPPPPGTPPFSAAELDLMMGYFLDNIDINGSGAVVAAPDYNTPGGSYYYHWMRDAALSMRALMITNSNATLVTEKMQSYVQWVLKVQNQPDPNGIDVRTEPKFTIPDGKPYSGGWCRPQTDGPGLRGGTLSLYALYLLNGTGASYVKQFLWTGSQSVYNGGAIKYDLDWVADNWQSNGCDLWEEVQSNDFFWNRYNFRYGLTVGAKVATQMGDSASASRYLSVAAQIQNTILTHYNGQYIFESTNRQKDAAVINGLNNGYLDDGFLAPSDYRVAQTISTLNDVFNAAFPINALDTLNGYGGILYGRYQGDTYAGGNPWILTTAALAQIYYNGAVEALRSGTLPSPSALKVFRTLIRLPPKRQVSAKEFATAMVQAGDDVLFRLRYHIAPDNFHCSEQLDKNTGVEMSAGDLTWSYACVLKAMHYRAQTQGGLI